ncbi:hypothetical protein LTR09_000169 [Extremus antarcticus]|uniref:Major facilitator superfamily (MFS) profile domain-containing protein n=1 Tax=Extremus antarcticus TaxID=702011 RepID=A0AAJ0LX36_9PEZI|nr:hypothetical protein LTR09_000169 [Extremus antarcticus]
MADIKSSASQIEGLDKPKQDVEILPEVLQGRSQDDLARLGRKTTLKLDLIIMRAMTTLYITNYLDRQNVAAANLAGITEDLNLSATQYQTVISILFVGYSPIEPRRLKDQVSGHIHLSAVFIWGTISACTAAVHSFGGLLACRFFLGLVEAAFFPGAFYYISMFYNRKQIAFRTAILYSGSQLGNAFGTLLAIGIMKLDGYHGIAGWRWLFLIEGIITIGFAVIFGLYLPNHPQKIMGLNEEERAWLRWNYETDQKQQDDSSEVTAKQGLMMAVTDPKTWLLCGTLYATYTAAAVNNFFPTVVLGLGFSRNKSYGLTAPPFILCVFCMLLNGFHSDKVSRDIKLAYESPLTSRRNKSASGT